MSWVAVGNPDDINKAHLLPKLCEPLGKILHEIEECSSDLKCCICGKTEERLSKEHTPSRKALNMFSGVSFNIDDFKTKKDGALQWESENFQGGVIYETLCENCNSYSGDKFNPEYIRFTRNCLKIIQADPQSPIVVLKGSFRLARIAKQAITTVLATCYSGLLDRFPDVRVLLLEPDRKGKPQKLRLHMFLLAHWRVVRITGLAVLANLEKQEAGILAEFSFWPFGWILSFDDKPIEGTVDVTNWFEYGYDERVDLELSVQRQWTFSALPADFRDPSHFQPGGNLTPYLESEKNAS